MDSADLEAFAARLEKRIPGFESDPWGGEVELFARKAEKHDPHGAAWVRMIASRRHAEYVSQRVRQLVGEGATQTAEMVARSYELNLRIVGELVQKSALELGWKQRKGLADRSAVHNRALQAERAREHERWMCAAASIRARHPQWPTAQVARQVKRDLGLIEHEDTIRKKVGRTS